MAFQSFIDILPVEIKMKIYIFWIPNISTHIKEEIEYNVRSRIIRNKLGEETAIWVNRDTNTAPLIGWPEHISYRLSKQELQCAYNSLSKCLCCARHSEDFGKTWEKKTSSLLKPGYGWTTTGKKGPLKKWKCECNCRHHRRFIFRALELIDV